MEELQIAKLPSNFKVYEIDDYHAINCDKEAKNFLDIINEAKKENDVQRYIKSNQKWFIPLSILKAYDFGHSFFMCCTRISAWITVPIGLFIGREKFTRISICFC